MAVIFDYLIMKSAEVVCLQISMQTFLSSLLGEQGMGERGCDKRSEVKSSTLLWLPLLVSIADLYPASCPTVLHSALASRLFCHTVPLLPSWPQFLQSVGSGSILLCMPMYGPTSSLTYEGLSFDNSLNLSIGFAVCPKVYCYHVAMLIA